MITVRTSAFETNSSSMHAIIIARGGYFNKVTVKVCMDANIDFSARTLIERKTPDEKASYCFHLIMNRWNSKLVRGKWNSETCEYDDISKKEIEQNEKVIAGYRKFVTYMKKAMKKHWKISLSVKNVLVKSASNGAELEPKCYASTGCYGHAALEAILFDNMFDTIDKFASLGSESPEFDANSNSGWIDFYDMAYFILNPNSVIIQNTDECDDKDRKKMQRMVMDYVKKNNGMCHVDWPFGG